MLLNLTILYYYIFLLSEHIKSIRNNTHTSSNICPFWNLDTNIYWSGVDSSLWILSLKIFHKKQNQFIDKRPVKNQYMARKGMLLNIKNWVKVNYDLMQIKAVIAWWCNLCILQDIFDHFAIVQCHAHGLQMWLSGVTLIKLTKVSWCNNMQLSPAFLSIRTWKSYVIE